MMDIFKDLQFSKAKQIFNNLLLYILYALLSKKSKIDNLKRSRCPTNTTAPHSVPITRRDVVQLKTRFTVNSIPTDQHSCRLTIQRNHPMTQPVARIDHYRHSCRIRRVPGEIKTSLK